MGKHPRFTKARRARPVCVKVMGAWKPRVAWCAATVGECCAWAIENLPLEPYKIEERVSLRRWVLHRDWATNNAEEQRERQSQEASDRLQAALGERAAQCVSVSPADGGVAAQPRGARARTAVHGTDVRQHQGTRRMAAQDAPRDEAVTPAGSVRPKEDSK